MHQKFLRNTDHQKYIQNLPVLMKNPVLFDTNASYNDQEFETGEFIQPQTIPSTNPLRKISQPFMRNTNSPEFKNEEYVNSSAFSKPKASNYNTGDPSYIDQFNGSQVHLVVGDPKQEENIKETQMGDLREYFKRKIVNAYNSIYQDNPSNFSCILKFST